MKAIPFTAALLIGGGLVSSALAVELQVPAGQSRTLDPALATAHFERWRLGDGATLILPESVPQWRWEVDRAEIGNGVRILGVGADGAPGADGQDRTGRAASCEDGAAGKPGTPGGAGAPGANLDLRLGVAALGSLAIEAPGGNGGAGGAGGRGQDGGHAGKCPGGDGGDGGAGGAGGAGGDGGQVRVRYYPLPGEGAPRDPAAAIRVSAAAGTGGAGGRGGAGGEGGKGGYVQTRTLTGNQQWVSGGDRGKTGAAGQDGAPGDTAAAMVESDVDRRLDQLLDDRTRPAATAPAADRKYQALERELEEMRRRLDALEKSGER
jgi:hypothetical protein